MKLNLDTFAKLMNDKWDKKDNLAMEYESGGSNYRTWKQDSSALYSNAGLLISGKIDHIRGGQQDDHVVLILGYATNGALVQGQALVQMKNEASIDSGIISTGDIAQAVTNAVRSKLKKDYGMSGSNSGRQNLPNVIQTNINNTTKAIQL